MCWERPSTSCSSAPRSWEGGPARAPGGQYDEGCDPMSDHREPIPAPFPLGTKLRYVGPPEALSYMAKYIQRGDVVIVDHVTRGARGGSMIPNPLDDGWGPAMVESSTSDGHSCIHFEAHPGDHGHLVGGERVKVWRDVKTTDGKVIDRVQVDKLVGGKRVWCIHERERALWEVVA